mmetsp:Transcript_66696/g.168229  ORF Transcript_66696/g.168229 Transcript_66696/m.168229 type:complete len:207 (-) Transcript_66696:317-937(-)
MDEALVGKGSGGDKEETRGPAFYALGFAGIAAALFIIVLLIAPAPPPVAPGGADAELCGGTAATSVNEAFNQFSKLVFAARNVSSPDFDANVDAIASCFATDTLVRFFNQNTGKLRVFDGRQDMRRFLLWVMKLVCAERSDVSELHSVDEGGRTVFIAWEYPTLGCKASTETYVYDKHLKIHRLNAFVDWPPLPPAEEAAAVAAEV